MNQRKWLRAIIGYVLTALLLNACNFSVEVLVTPTPTSPAPTLVPIEPTITPVPPTPVSASATPTLIPIRADTLSMLEIFTSLNGGELPRALAFTPDSAVLAAAGGNESDFAIRLWDVPNGQSLRTLDGHTGIVWSLAFSPDGQMLASVSSDKTAKVWDWQNGTLLKSLNFPGEVVSVSFSPDGQTLAVGGVDEVQDQVQMAAVWTFSVGSWNPMFKLPEYLNITALAYSPNGRWLVGGGTSRNLQVWRTSDGTPVFTLNHAHQIPKVAISPDSSTVAAATCAYAVNDACTEGGFWLWDLTTGKLIQKFGDFPAVVESVAFTVDGSSLIVASRDGMVRIYDTANYQDQFQATPPGGNGTMALSRDGGLLATVGANGTIHLWKVVYRP